MASFDERRNASHSFRTHSPRADRQKRGRRQAVLERLEDRIVLDASLTIDATNLLTFKGDNVAAGQVAVTFAPGGGGTYTITDAGVKINITNNGSNVTTTGSGTSNVTVKNLGSLNTAALDFIGTSNFGDTFHINSIDNPLTLENQLGGSVNAPLYYLGNTTNGMQSINAPVNIKEDQLSFPNIFLDDSADTTARPNIALTDSGGTATVTGISPFSVTYEDSVVASLNILGGSGGNGFTYNVSAGNIYPVEVKMGTGSLNSMTVLATNGILNAIVSQQGTNVINLGAAGPTGTTQNLKGPVTITNSGGNTELNVNDQGDTTGRNVSLDVDNVNNKGTITGIAPAEIFFTPALISAFTINGGSGGNTFNVANTVAGVTSTLNTGTGNDHVTVLGTVLDGGLNIEGESGDDDVTIGDNGTLTGFLGDLHVANLGGFTNLTVDDSNDSTDTDFNLVAANSITGRLLGATQGSLTYTTNDLSHLNVDSGTGTDSLTVDFSAGNPIPQDTPQGLVYNGGIGSPSSTLNLINGVFANETYTTFGPGTGDITYLDGSTPASSTDIGFNGLTPINDIVPITGTFTINAASGTLNVVNSNPPTFQGVQTGLVSSGDVPASFERINYGNKPTVVVNSTQPGSDIVVNNPTPAAGLENLIVNGSSAGDQIQLQKTAPGINTTINGQAGNDTVNAVLSGITAPAAPATPLTLADGGSGINTLNVDVSGATAPVTSVPPGPGTPGLISGLFATGTGALQYQNFQTVVINNNPSTPPVVTALPFSTYDGQNLVDVQTATFTSADPGAKAGDFLATIDWGDGTVGHPDTSAGVIVQDAQIPSVFHVTGTHQYATQGSYTVTVSVLHTSSTQTTVVNGTTIIIHSVTPPGTPPVTATSTATVNPSPLGVQAFNVTGVEGTPLSSATNQILASFTDSRGPSSANDYEITINWGDGSPVFLGSPGQFITQSGTNANGANYTVAVPPHQYNSNGQFPITVTVTSLIDPTNLISASAASLAVITDAQLTPIPQTFSATEGQPFLNTVVGEFTDANTAGSGSDFTAVIDWGDGSPSSVGFVTAVPGAPAGTYEVTGRHTYANALANGPQSPFVPETFQVTVSVTDKGGATTQINSTGNVFQRPFVVSGNLNPSNDTGVSKTDNVTSIKQPNFVGHSEPLSTVQLYAYTAANPTPVLIGQGTTDTSGFWTITANTPLADGTYTVAAVAVSKTGYTSESALIVPSLVVDTQGPVVQDVVFDRVHGRIDVTFQDNLAGMSTSTMVDASNYLLTRRGSRQLFLVNHIAVTPDATNPLIDTVVLTINKGKQIRGGRYTFTVKGTDPITDNAGNALAGVFYSYFPSGNGHNGTDFVARLSGVHHSIFSPKTVFGKATPNTPPGTPSTGTTYIATANPYKASGNPGVSTAKVVHGASVPHGHAAKHHHG